MNDGYLSLWSTSSACDDGGIHHTSGGITRKVWCLVQGHMARDKKYKVAYPVSRVAFHEVHIWK